jgi:signal transduction histidine kinase
MKSKRKGRIIKIIIILAIQSILLTVLFFFSVISFYKTNYQQWRNSQSAYLNNQNEKIIERIQNDMANKAIVKNIKNKETMRLATTPKHWDYGQAYLMITDRETGEVIIDSKERCFMTISDSEADRYKEDYSLRGFTYINDSESLISWMKKTSEEYEKNVDEAENYYLIFEVKKYCIDENGYFYPLEMLAYCKSVYGGGEQPQNDSWHETFDIRDYEKINNLDSMEIVENTDSGFVYLVGSETNLNDYSLKGENDPEHYYSGGGESHTYQFPPLVNHYYEYNRSFVKGDYIIIRRTPFILTEESEEGVVVKNYVLELYYKSNYWEEYGKSLLPLIYIIYGIVISLAAIISLIINLIKLIKKEKVEYQNTLIDSISHDLKSPLTALRGYAESLKENLNEEKKEAYADAIIDSTDYMDRLINGNISLLQLQDMRSVHKRDKADLVELTKELFEKYGPVLEERNIILNISGNCERRVNKDLMTNALENLVSNSIKYVNDGGEITIEGNGEGLKFTNTVDSFPERKPEELWETFVKGDDSRSNEKGSGIGLAIAKRIFDIHKIKSSIEYKDGEYKQFVVNLF